MTTASAIRAFQGEYRFLSNCYPAPMVDVDGKVYPTAEHAYQGVKTRSASEREAIRLLDTPGKAKRAGRKVTLRPDWERIKVFAMYRIVRQKFTQNADLQRRLLETGDAELIEGNRWGDTFWGVCDGKGHNHLGQILMIVRDEIRDRIS